MSPFRHGRRITIEVMEQTLRHEQHIPDLLDTTACDATAFRYVDHATPV